MIDRGWRRAGTFCYKPDLKNTCCPEYTIRLDALEFKASRSQRQLVNRWNRFVLEGKEHERMDTQLDSKKRMPKKMPPFSLCDSIHTYEKGFIEGSQAPFHNFETTLETSSYTDEKYALYEKYQSNVHHDNDNEPKGFKRFLVDSPLLGEIIPYENDAPSHLPKTYGSYHQLYRLNGELIALGVLDILPHCVSSVYFMYDVEWEEFSLGKLSALREISLACEMHKAGAPGMGFLYMGFFIYSCPKMRYKGEYSPSYLADPETYDWFPLSTCTEILKKHRYAAFSHPEHSLCGAPEQGKEEPDFPSFDEVDLDEIFVVSDVVENQIIVKPITASDIWHYKELRYEIQACVRGLGIELAKDIVMMF